MKNSPEIQFHLRALLPWKLENYVKIIFAMELMDLHASVGNGKSGRCASSSAINHLQTTAPASAPIKKNIFGNQFAIERFFTPEKATTQKYEINFHE